MKRMVSGIFIMVAIACGGIMRASGQAQTFEMADIGAILRAGVKAEKDQDGIALMRNARALALLGAHPAEGENDLVLAWFAQGKALGAKPGHLAVLRGRTLGPAYRRGSIAAHATFKTTQSVNAGQQAAVVVTSASGAVLSLEVRNEDNQSACPRMTSAKSLRCQWIPVFTGLHSIQISNTSSFSDSYFIVVN
jgi:hypothetical protein